MKYLDNDGNMYKGESLYGVAYGKGKCIISDRESWEGEWKFGKPHGKVKYRNLKGDFYFGDYKNGRKNGKGVHLFANGKIYSGEFRDGKLSDKGIYFSLKGETYCGQFLNGKKNGKGMYYYSDGRIYSGEYGEGERNGKGVEVFTDDAIYSGLYKNDKPDGSGWMFFPEGGFKDNYTLLHPSNSVFDIIINEGISDDMRVIFERENKIIKLINNFHVNNSKIFDILNKKLKENMYNSINLRYNFNNINLEEIIFNLLLDINKVGEFSILFSLISKKSSNLYFSPHTILLYGYYQEFGRKGIIIIDSLFLLLYYYLLLF
jgi:hypothetical protein